MTEKKFAPRYPNLGAALSAAQGLVEAATKSSKSQQYAYASREEIASTAQRALAETGLAFALMGPVAIHDGAAEWRARLFHEANDEVLEWTVVWPTTSGGRQQPDKATGSAMSYAYKNALINVLNIPREPEETASNRVDARNDPGAGNPPVKAVPRRETPKDKAERDRENQLEAVRTILREVGCKTRQDGLVVIHWATRGEYSYDSMMKVDEGPGDVLGALNELNEGKVPFGNMLDWAYEKEEEESRRANQ